MPLKRWLLIGAFVLLVLADLFATALWGLSWALADIKRMPPGSVTAMIVGWVALVASALWMNGPGWVRLILATGPILGLVYMMSYEFIWRAD